MYSKRLLAAVAEKEVAKIGFFLKNCFCNLLILNKLIRFGKMHY